jgi:serine/threonine protein kinase
MSLTKNGTSRPTKSHLSTIAYVGTLSYMSPERLDGKEYSFSSDIWALGMIIYELVTG